MQIIEKTAEIGDKLVLFSQSIETLDAFEQFLALQNHHWNHIIWARNQTYLRFDGTTSGSDREQLINRFNNESDLHLFLISTRAGSLVLISTSIYDIARYQFVFVLIGFYHLGY